MGHSATENPTGTSAAAMPSACTSRVTATVPSLWRSRCERPDHGVVPETAS